MKALVQVLTLVVLSFMVNNANAQSSESVVKVPATKVAAHAEVASLELYDGDRINVAQIRRHSNRAGEILGRSQIELNDGQIVYPEEVRYAVVRGLNDKNPHQKNPHQQN